MPKKTTEFASRFSASLPPKLMREFDALVRDKGYENRSLAIADMIRDQLVEHRKMDGEQEIAGSVTLVYDHHQRQLQHVLNQVQHDYGHHVIATLHCHLDHDNCLEIVAVRGPAKTVRLLADKLVGTRGVKHGKLTITSTGRDLPV